MEIIGSFIVGVIVGRFLIRGTTPLIVMAKEISSGAFSTRIEQGVDGEREG